MLWFQHTELDARLAEVPQGNLDATADGTEHEAQHKCMTPVDVPPHDRDCCVERTSQIWVERTLEIIGTGCDVQVQESWTEDDTDERLPGHRNCGVDTADQTVVVTVCRHLCLPFCWEGRIVKTIAGHVLPVLAE